MLAFGSSFLRFGLVSSLLIIAIRCLVVIIVVVVIVVVVELVGILLSVVHVVAFFTQKSFSSEPVDGVGDQLLLDLFAQVVVELKAFLGVGSDGVLGFGDLWGRKEVEEGFRGNGDLDDTRLFGVCMELSIKSDLTQMPFTMGRRLTLVALLFAFMANSQVFAGLPLDLVALSMIVHDLG